MSDQTYGYRRIHSRRPAGAETCSPGLVRGIVPEPDLVPCWPPAMVAQPHRRRPTADPIPTYSSAISPAQCPAKLIGGITYSPTWEGWAYLAMNDNYKPPLIEVTSTWL